MKPTFVFAVALAGVFSYFTILDAELASNEEIALISEADDWQHTAQQVVPPPLLSGPPLLEAQPENVSSDDTDVVTALDMRAISSTGETPSIVHIGEPMDPDDPSTWTRPEDAEVINIGALINPDDPATWPQDDPNQVRNIGMPVDPDDPATWPQAENTEISNIGEPLNPDDLSIWFEGQNPEVVNIGEPMNPDEPSAWNIGN